MGMVYGGTSRRCQDLAKKLEDALDQLPLTNKLMPRFITNNSDNVDERDVVMYLQRYVHEVVGNEKEHIMDSLLQQSWDQQIGRAHSSSLRLIVAAQGLSQLLKKSPKTLLMGPPSGVFADHVFCLVQWTEKDVQPLVHVVGAYRTLAAAKSWAVTGAHRCRSHNRLTTPINVSLSHLGSYVLDLPAVQGATVLIQRVHFTVFHCPMVPASKFHVLLQVYQASQGALRSCEFVGIYATPEEAIAANPDKDVAISDGKVTAAEDGNFFLLSSIEVDSAPKFAPYPPQ
mmetsp:Transcript_89041/g.147879  ORF Transcript_89041/g.147879 Transcript_89041/m.147879 type:complete len:286 (-) Transcript_89041:59-916(-)